MFELTRDVNQRQRAQSDSNASDVLSREVALICSVPSTVFDGLCKRVEEIKQNPLSAAGLQVGIAAALGIGCAVISKNPKAILQPVLGNRTDLFLNQSKRLLPLAGSLMIAGDIGGRTVPVMWDTAVNADHLEANKKQLGYNLGSMAIDYPLTGLAGTAGSLAADTAMAARPGVQALLRETAQFNGLRPAYAGGVTQEVFAKSAGETLADSMVLFKTREVNLPSGQRLELHDNGHAVMHADGTSVNYKHKTVQNNLDLIYQPFDDIGQLLNSIRIVGSQTVNPFFMIQEMLNGKAFSSILKHFPGKWEPEYSTNTCLELRSQYTGEVANLKHDYGTPDCPFVIQPLQKYKLDGCTIEKLPSFTRPFEKWNSDWNTFYDKVRPSQVMPIKKQMKEIGFSCSSDDPMIWGQLDNGRKVVLDPRLVHEMQYPGAWEELNHQKGIKLFSAALHDLVDVYGSGSKAVARLSARLGQHCVAARQTRNAETLFKNALAIHQKNGDYYDAHEAAQDLFYLYRNLSDCGTKGWMLDKAVSYSNLATELLQKSFIKQ